MNRNQQQQPLTIVPKAEAATAILSIGANLMESRAAVVRQASQLMSLVTKIEHSRDRIASSGVLLAQMGVDSDSVAGKDECQQLRDAVDRLGAVSDLIADALEHHAFDSIRGIGRTEH